jgi:hypothetical protein
MLADAVIFFKDIPAPLLGPGEICRSVQSGALIRVGIEPSVSLGADYSA